MAQVYEKLISANGKIFNVLRRLFFPPDSTLELLSVDDESNDFNVEETLIEGWYLEYSETRRTFRLEIASNDLFLKENIMAVSHVRINEDVYLITKSDTISAVGENPVWTLFCERDFRRSAFSAAT